MKQSDLLTGHGDESNNASDEAIKQYINCDEDANYYIKEYMEDSGLELVLPTVVTLIK